jgi:L-amino acid N-acyltransferase YncA
MFVIDYSMSFTLRYSIVFLHRCVETRLKLRDALPADASALAAIYNHYVTGTTITFEEEAVGAADMARRIADVQSAALPWLVAADGDGIIGYAYATKWRVRHAYRFSVESTVYLAPGRSGQGAGTALYEAMLDRLREAGYHLVIGGIALPNEASVALHEKLGFEKVAQFGEVGFKFGRWIDVGYWQRKLPNKT